MEDDKIVKRFPLSYFGLPNNKGLTIVALAKCKIFVNLRVFLTALESWKRRKKRVRDSLSNILTVTAVLLLYIIPCLAQFYLASKLLHLTQVYQNVCLS